MAFAIAFLMLLLFSVASADNSTTPSFIFPPERDPNNFDYVYTTYQIGDLLDVQFITSWTKSNLVLFQGNPGGGVNYIPNSLNIPSGTDSINWVINLSGMDQNPNISLANGPDGNLFHFELFLPGQTSSGAQSEFFSIIPNSVTSTTSTTASSSTQTSSTQTSSTQIASTTATTTTTSSSSSATASPTQSGSSGLSAGAQAGIGIGAALAGIALFLGIGWMIISSRRKQKETELNQTRNIYPLAGPMVHEHAAKYGDPNQYGSHVSPGHSFGRSPPPTELAAPNSLS